MPEGPPQHQIDRSHARQHARPIVSQTLAEMAPWLIIAVPLSMTVYNCELNICEKYHYIYSRCRALLGERAKGHIEVGPNGTPYFVVLAA
jgi:hypothetical protein